MILRQDPVTKFWCREDGAICMPPAGRAIKKFRWVLGSSDKDGYLVVNRFGKIHRVHRVICRAFHGESPSKRPYVDHIDRNPAHNSASNLRWVSPGENNDNTRAVDRGVALYGVRPKDDRRAYSSAYYMRNRETIRAQQAEYWSSHKTDIAKRRRASKESFDGI